MGKLIASLAGLGMSLWSAASITDSLTNDNDLDVLKVELGTDTKATIAIVSVALGYGAYALLKAKR